MSAEAGPRGWDAVAPVWYRGEGLPHFAEDNFGDGPLNRFLLPRLFPKLVLGPRAPSHALLGAGSLLGLWPELRGVPPGAPLLVFGSGLQYGRPRPLPAGSRVFCVRGAWSARALGLPERLGVADPALLLPHFLPRDREAVAGRMGRYRKWDYGRPRWSGASPRRVAAEILRAGQALRLRAARRRRERTGPGPVLESSRTGPSLEGFLRRLWRCERVETDAFHVAVAADAYGIPWRPLRWEPKWADHFERLGLGERPRGFALSEAAGRARATTTLLERREELIRFVESGGAA